MPVAGRVRPSRASARVRPLAALAAIDELPDQTFERDGCLGPGDPRIGFEHVIGIAGQQPDIFAAEQSFGCDRRDRIGRNLDLLRNGEINLGQISGRIDCDARHLADLDPTDPDITASLEAIDR